MGSQFKVVQKLPKSSGLLRRAGDLALVPDESWQTVFRANAFLFCL